MDRSFIPPTKKSEGQIERNTAGSGVYSPNNNIHISERLPGNQNILRPKLNAILLGIKNIKNTKIEMLIFTDSLSNIFLINNHIRHPTSQHHHPDKLLIAAIVRQIYWTPHIIHIHKVRAHTCIIGNEIADTLANKGTHKEKPSPTPQIRIAHPTPYWLVSCPTTTHNGAIRNLSTFLGAHGHQKFPDRRFSMPNPVCPDDLRIVQGFSEV